MDNFEIDKEAKLMSDSRSAYNLAREVIELREKLKQPKSIEVMCPHCTNVISSNDTACTHCGEAVQPMDPLTVLCLQLGIPPIIEREGKQCVIFELQCRADGIQANYMAPGEVREIQIEGTLH